MYNRSCLYDKNIISNKIIPMLENCVKEKLSTQPDNWEKYLKFDDSNFDSDFLPYINSINIYLLKITII